MSLLLKFHTAIANSCIDVSDGLISDLGHILEASRVGGEINVERIALVGTVEDALTWGDDYELLITIPPGQKQSLLEISERFDVDISEIGKITRESDLRVIEKGSLISFQNLDTIILMSKTFQSFLPLFAFIATLFALVNYPSLLGLGGLFWSFDLSLFHNLFFLKFADSYRRYINHNLDFCMGLWKRLTFHLSREEKDRKSVC